MRKNIIIFFLALLLLGGGIYCMNIRRQLAESENKIKTYAEIILQVEQEVHANEKYAEALANEKYAAALAELNRAKAKSESQKSKEGSK